VERWRAKRIGELFRAAMPVELRTHVFARPRLTVVAPWRTYLRIERGGYDEA